MKIIIHLIFFIALSFGCIAQTSASTNDFRIVGFYKGTLADIGRYEYNKLTHIIFGFTYLKGNEISLKDTDEKMLVELVKQKRSFLILRSLFLLVAGVLAKS